MRLVLLFCLITSVVVSQAQTSREREVAQAVEKLRLAMISGEESQLSALISNALSYGHSGGAVDTKEQFLSKFRTGQSDFVTIELKEQTIAVTGKAAVVRHVLHATTNDNGKAGEAHIRVLLVWQRVKGEWKLLARQAVKMG